MSSSSVGEVSPSRPTGQIKTKNIDSNLNLNTLNSTEIQSKFSELKTSPKGLTSIEAQDRLAKDGPNAIQAHEESRWKKLLGYFWGQFPG